MRLNDACHLQHPYYGSRRIRDWLEDHDRVVNRKRVQRLMRQLGMVALYPKRNTSRRSQAHRVYPYLLRGLEVTRPDPVRAADVTCVPMARGLLNVVAIMHWHSRKVLSSQVSNTMDTGFCVQALQDALSRYAQPEILNTDQGSQFAREGFTTLLRDQGIQIGMDGKGRWVDNVFVKRQWRSLKYEDIYLKAYEVVAEARRGIGRYFHFYNNQWTHQVRCAMAVRRRRHWRAAGESGSKRASPESGLPVASSEPVTAKLHCNILQVGYDA
jgi:putative transposase